MSDQEAIENLSPEELEELMQKNCLFCGIVGGQVPSVRVYEDQWFIGILDINPVHPGHVILLPKKHVMSVEELDGDLLSAEKRIVSALKKGFEVTGVTILMPEGVSAGQKLPHASIHLIPRQEGDGLFEIQGAKAEEKDLQTAASKITSNLAAIQDTELVPEPVIQDDNELDKYVEEESVP